MTGPPTSRPTPPGSQWADALVLVYPTWWGAQPAILWGWLDRVWIDGIAFSRRPGARRARPGLRNIRHLVAITTHGSSKWINAVEGEPGKRVVLRRMRACCHPRVRTRWIALYGVDRSDEAERRAFLAAGRAVDGRAGAGHGSSRSASARRREPRS